MSNPELTLYAAGAWLVFGFCAGLGWALAAALVRRIVK